MTAIPTWLHDLAIASLAIGFVSAAVIAVDLVRRPQHMWIMNLVWPITALYFGPIAIWWYATFRGAKAFWKTVIVETTHCGAGCSLGDVIAEFSIFFRQISLFGSMLFTEYLGDFVLAYAFGIVFQYFAIAPMRGLSLLPGLRAAIVADTLAVIAFEVGLFAWMAFMTTLPFHEALTPVEPAFWLLMQIGMVIGFATSYPANWFLVRAGVKEPM